MLPAPAFSFTIPSVHDDVPLDCRVYHPTKSSPSGVARHRIWRRKGAILAHPYGPLGGCYDDPVVQVVATEMLKGGFVVGTFNFRGSGSSKGRTSWTAKPELADYSSFVGFFIYYLNGLQPSGSTSSNGYTQTPSFTESPLLPIQSALTTPTDPPNAVSSRIVLVLGGYSYGSLIAMNLPSVDAILSRFIDIRQGTAEAEIRLRASNLSTQWNTEVHRKSQRGRSLTVEDVTRGTSHSIAMGGDESEPGTRRKSRESKRSVNLVRRSVDRSRQKLGPRKPSSEELSAFVSAVEKLPSTEALLPETHYLLISPLLPPISMLATMFTQLSSRRHHRSPFSNQRHDRQASHLAENLLHHPTLAVYGDKDFFTSPKKLRKWSENLAEAKDSCFRFHEIAGAGHFWHEDGVEAELRSTIGCWVADIVATGSELYHPSLER
ncbi:MAG: hypothetical protein Q9187_001912 [Circinaria calcarea]